MPDYAELRLFSVLAANLHFGRTARVCHVSPSALSRTIQRLESDLGARLFERDQHRVQLTAAGTVLRRHAEAVLADWEAIERELRAAANAGLGGTLRVYCTVTAAQSLLPEVLGAFRQSYPDIHLDLETGYASDLLEQLAAREVDVAVAPLPERIPSGLLAQEIATTRVVLAAPAAPGPVRSAVERRRIEWSDVPLILPARGVTRSRADRWLRARGVAPQIYAEVQGHEAILSLVALGCGVGVVPGLVLEKSALRHAVREVEVRPPLERLRVGLCIRRRSETDPLIGALWRSVVEWSASSANG